MKRILMVTLLVLCTAVLIFAQGIRSQQEARDQEAKPQPQAARAEQAMERKTVTGNLTLVRGMIAIKSDDMTYLLPGLIRYAGFIEELKDGALVKIEGMVRAQKADAKTVVLIPAKLTLGNKDYDIGMPMRRARMQQQNQQHNQQRPQMQAPGQRNNMRSQDGCPYCNNPQHIFRF